MKQYLSRTEAAKVLGCDPQSISNYASRGLFEIMKGDKCVYVEKSSFEKFVNEYFETVKAHEDIKAELDKELDDYRAEIARRHDALDGELEMMRAEKDYYTFVRSGFIRTACLELVDLLKGDNLKRAQIWNDLLDGRTRDDIKGTYGITKERVRQHIERFLLDLRRSACAIRDIKKDNEELSRRCRTQHDHIIELQIDIKNQKDTIKSLCDALHIKQEEYGGDVSCSLIKNAIKSVRVYDVCTKEGEFSVRALNGLKAAECYTLYDVVMLQRNDLKKIHNMGKKTIGDIEMILEAYGYEHFGTPLTFDMDL